jgi:hypothetical protein
MSKPRVMFDSSVMIAAATSGESNHQVANDSLRGSISLQAPEPFL